MRLAQNEALTRPYVFFEQHAGVAHLPFGEEDRPNKTVVSTYAQFGAWIQRNPDFAANFEVIICDEAHNIVLFPTYSPEPNCASIARDAICEAATGGRTLVVGITATPEPLERLACPQHIVPIDQSVLRQYENKEVRPYSSLPQLFSQIPEGKRGMLYTKHIEMMKKCEEQAKAAGRHPICIWSAANTDNPLNDEQLRARAYILEHEEVPPQYDLFIFNASCETSINIRGQMDYFIAHTTTPTNITQARGRYRGDLETLYLFDRDTDEPLIVPDEFLDIQLFEEDKRKLRLYFSIKDKKGHYLSYDKQWSRLEASGYDVDYGRANNRHYVIIRKP